MHQLTENSLGSLGSPQLVELLGSNDFGLSQATAELLFRRGASALDALVEGLSHSNWRVRKNCAALMDHLGDDRCIEPLRRALSDPIVGVRRHAIHALGCQPCKSAPLQADIVSLLVERSLSDPSIRVRRVAVHMLGLQPCDARAIAALQAIVHQETDPRLLSRARHALAEHQKKAGEDPVLSCPSRRRERIEVAVEEPV
jgi:HEAT repeat protein